MTSCIRVERAKRIPYSATPCIITIVGDRMSMAQTGCSSVALKAHDPYEGYLGLYQCKTCSRAKAHRFTNVRHDGSTSTTPRTARAAKKSGPRGSTCAHLANLHIRHHACHCWLTSGSKRRIRKVCSTQQQVAYCTIDTESWHALNK